MAQLLLFLLQSTTYAVDFANLLAKFSTVSMSLGQLLHISSSV